MLNLKMTGRIQELKEKMLAEPRFASIEQARIITEVYKENEGKPRILQRALALQAALSRIVIKAEPEELIVGNRTAGVRYGVVFPESGSTWVDREFETLPVRPQDRFNVRQEDIDEFREVIKPYWQGKSLEDVLRECYGKEIDAIAKVVKINQKDHAQGHICPNCAEWLAKGPAGLRLEAEEKLHGAQGRQKDFYEAVRLTMQGEQSFMQRYSSLLQQMAEKEEHAAWRENILQAASNCQNLSERPPQSFHEAVQSLWFLFFTL